MLHAASVTMQPREMPVLCLPSARVLSQPGHTFRRDDRGELVSLAEALTRSWATDAHLVGYAARRYDQRDRWRLNSAAVERGDLRIAMGLLVIDCDAPGHEASPQWRAELRGKLQRLEAVHSGLVAYQTRGGARLLWRLGTPHKIASATDARAWTAAYRGAVDYLADRFDIQADRACDDWTRLFRLPRVIRDGEMQAGEIVAGDVANIGTIDLAELSGPARGVRIEPAGDNEAAAPDVSTSATDASPRDQPGTLARGDRTARQRGAYAETDPGSPFIDPTGPGPHGADLEDLATDLEELGGIRAGHYEPALLRLCRDAGLLLAEREPGVWAIRCPRSTLHTADTGGTILYADTGTGTIKCMHAHCAGVDTAGWLQALGVAASNVETTTVTVKRAFPNDGERLRLELQRADGSLISCRISSPPRGPLARWRALWNAAGVDVPSDCNPAGDLGDACHELEGRTLDIEYDISAARSNPVVRFLVPVA